MSDTGPGETGWQPVGEFEVRTEDRGNGIIAVYVRGPARRIHAIQRAARAYVQHHLTFAPGTSRGVMTSDSEFTDDGATYTCGRVYATQPLPLPPD